MKKSKSRQKRCQGQLEVVDDLVDFPYHLGPAPAGDSWAFLLTNDEWMLVGLPLPHFAPVSIGIQAEVTEEHPAEHGAFGMSGTVHRLAELILWIEGHTC